jgi:biopolymer transport protein ExbD
LPEASVVNDLEPAPVIALDGHGVFLNGMPVGEAAGADWKIPELHDYLVTLKNNYKLLHPNEPWHGVALLAADRDTPFETVRRVLYTLEVAGYPRTQLTVERTTPRDGS